jgi:GNAT superfamily N-acetyltransferase
MPERPAGRQGRPALELEPGAPLTVADYRRFRAAVGWTPPPGDDEAIQAALDTTWNVAARADGELVGIGRLLDDGALYAAIWDMIVLPGAQRRGVGRAILERLLEHASTRTIVVLVATPAGRPLYEEHGFRAESGSSVGMLLRPGAPPA